MKQSLHYEFSPTGLSNHLKSKILLFTFFCLAHLGTKAQINLEITEIFSGQVGADLTPDWFEIKNTGSTAWVSGVDGDLYYDDESASAADADLIEGITDIQPGESVIVIIDVAAEISTFNAVWSPVINLTGIEIANADGAGLGGSGDMVNIWIGDPNTSNPVATGAYPATDNNDGQTYDLTLAAFSEVGNTNGAVQTLAVGGSTGDVPNIGSPGNQGPNVLDPDAPVITGDSVNANPFINLRIETSSAISADLNTTTDGTSLSSLPFIITDADHAASDITLTATSDNQAAIPDANLMITGTEANRSLTVTPSGVGTATISLIATDPDGKTGTYTLNYAVSDAAFNFNTRFYGGASDGSTAIPTTDLAYLWVADDEDQTIRLYTRANRGCQ